MLQYASESVITVPVNPTEAPEPGVMGGEVSQESSEWQPFLVILDKQGSGNSISLNASKLPGRGAVSQPTQ